MRADLTGLSSQVTALWRLVDERIDAVGVAEWDPADPAQGTPPPPGAQLRFTDSDGHWITGFLTDTPDGVVPSQLAGLELRHRQTRPRRGPDPPSQGHQTA